MPSKIWNDSPEGRAWRKAYYAEYNARNREKLRASDKKSYEKNKAKRVAKSKKWNEENKARYLANKRKSNKNLGVLQKLALRIRVRLNNALRRDSKRGSAVRLLGCSIVDFRDYIENKFLPGMSWDNWSIRGWHIDHIKPLSAFDLSDPEQLASACHYTNLQPLWASENCSKGAKYG